MSETQNIQPAGRCDGCGTDHGPFMKLSMGKDFFGRSYDRLSPSSDRSPQWYCDPCSMHKNLQREVRDIRAEFDKVVEGQSSELTGMDQVQRALLRLQEIAALLSTQTVRSVLIDPQDVNSLIQRMHIQLSTTTATA